MLKWIQLKGESREYHLQDLIASVVTGIASKFFWKYYAHLELNEILQVVFLFLFFWFCETREGLSLVLPVYVTCEEHLVSGLSHAPCVHIPYVGWFIWEGAGATVTQSSVSSMDSRWRANSPS